MKIELSFRDEKIMDIRKVELIGDFGEIQREMLKDESGEWKIALGLEPGEYHYQFLINGELRLNDPTANMYYLNEADELLSCLIINENGKRLFNTTRYEIEWRTCEITNHIGDHMPNTKRHFNIYEDKSICLGTSFEKVEGLHTMTVIWVTPDHELYEYTDYALSPKVSNEYRIWTQMDLDKLQCMGEWMINILIDGKLFKQESIQVSNRPLDKYLPIGSVVKLKGANKALMIYGFAQITEQGKVWDYVSCMYPEGLISSHSSIFFNHDGIEEVEFLGFETPEAAAFSDAIKAAEKHRLKKEEGREW